MKFVIDSSNVKVFAKSVLSLSKIGDEIYVEPLQNSVRKTQTLDWTAFESSLSVNDLSSLFCFS